MASILEHPHEFDRALPSASLPPARAANVLEELDRILASRFFKNAVRCRQFLEYVVRHKLDGHAEQLKERTIGTDVFQRAAGYATGDDPVVRVQAGEVRRRLEQYYQSLPGTAALRIELTSGSYSPNFHWLAEDSHPKTINRQPPALSSRLPRPHTALLLIAAVLLVVTLVVGLFFSHLLRSPGQPTNAETFWAPVFGTPQPVLICLAKPIVYRPSFALYQRFSASHPGSFDTEVERSNKILPLDPHENVPWKEVVPYNDYGVAVGDVYAAVGVSSYFGQIRKPSQVRIGANYSFEDLSNSPSVILGAFNNHWTMQIVPGLHFAFVEDNAREMIREQVPDGKVWVADVLDSRQSGVDYAIVARLLDSRTGQFTVIAAGLTGSGTAAAGEFISNPGALERGLRSLPVDWQKKNLELVIKTNVTDEVAGPPEVIGQYIW